MSLPVPLGTTDQNVAYYAAVFDQHYPGQGLGAAYTEYASAQIAGNSSISPYKAAQAFALIIATKGFAAALAAAASATANATNQAGTSASAGAGNAIHNLTSPNWLLQVSGISGWFFRGLKILFGGILLIVGISRLTGVDNKVTQAATTAAGALKVIPV